MQLSKFKFQHSLLALFFIVLLLLQQVGNVYAATFTPGFAKRSALGPFTTAPIIQGRLDTWELGDSLSADFPSAISGQFNPILDARQGSIVLWANFEGDGAKSHILVATFNSQISLSYNDTTHKLVFEMNNWGGTTSIMQTDFTPVPGVSYSIIARWDSQNTLDGTNYASISVNDAHTFGITAPTTPTVVGNLGIGSSAGGYSTGDTIIEGLTIYRRPLFDGTYGVDVGNGDEIFRINNGGTHNGLDNSTSLVATNRIGNLEWVANELIGATVVNQTDGSSATITSNTGSYIYGTLSGGSENDWDIGDSYIVTGKGGVDSALITGTWDVVFALPTNQSNGVLTTTGQAWSHPHASNLLYTSTTNTGGFMMNGTYTNDNWTDEGTPSTVTALATAEKIYAGGYKTTSTAVNQGIYYSEAVAAGNDWVIRALGNSDGTCTPKVILYDQTNGAEIGSLAGTTTSTRTDPDVYIFTGEAPVGMSELRVKLINTAATGTCYWHQVEVLPNLITNPSVETGGGDPWIPTGWTNDNLIAGDTTTIAGRTGTNAWGMTRPGTGVCCAQIRQDPTLTTGNFYALDFWHKRDTSSRVTNGYNYGLTKQYLSPRWDGLWDSLRGSSASWTHFSAVLRAGSTSGRVTFGGYTNAGTLDLDDIALFALNSISLTIRASTLEQSTENTDEIRVDGRDTYISSSAEATSIAPTAGFVSFNWRPRHAPADATKFVENGNANLAYIVSLSDSTTYDSGKHSGSNNATALTDHSKSWTTNQFVNYKIHNLTDGSSGTITANTTTQITTTLSGGTDNDWDTNDVYEIISTNNIRVFWSSANTITMAYSMNGTVGKGTWDATGTIAANTEYTGTIAYTGDGSMIFSINDVPRITLSSIPASFASSPNTVYWGSSPGGSNQGDATFSNFVFDNTPPSISLTALSPDPNNDNTPTLTGTATEGIGTVSAVEFQMDGTGGSWTACSADDSSFNSNSEAFTCTVSVALSDGSHTMNVRATDSNGNTTADGSVTTDTFTIDASTPTGGSVSYTDGYYSTASVSLTVDDGADATAGIDTSSRTVQRTSATLSAGSCGSYDSFATIAPSGSYPSFTDTSVSTGTCYQYRYLVSDLATNQATYTSSNTVKMDTAAPAVPGTPTTTTPTADTTPTWSWTASSDTASGLSAAPYTIEWSQSSSFASGVSTDTSATNSFTHTTPLTDGTWYFRVKATDVAGNDSSYSANGSVQINTGAPTGTVSINAGAGYVKTTSVTLTLSASSGFFSGTADIQMKVSNLSDLSDASYEAFSATKAWTLTDGDGTKTVYVQFKDTTGNESGAYTDTIILDSVAPNSFDMQNPGNNSYINSDRPSFKWKASSDATSGLSKYKLDVDNGSEDDFTIDDIPVDRTTTFEALNYSIEYHNFGGSDQTNNSISVQTKSSLLWGFNHNDGKLKEGKRSWKVIATDSAGNEKTQEHTIFVDTTSPSVELTQLNDQSLSTNNFSTSDSTPTIFGTSTDPLHGDTTSTDEQVKQDNQVASGPKSVEVQLEKKNADGNYTLDTLTTLNLTQTYWSSDGTLISDNTQQTANKYSTFEYTPQTALPLGEYRIKIKGIDQTGNTGGETTLYLTITTFQALATTDQQEQLSTLIKKVTTELPSATEEEKDALKQELTDSAEITKPEEPRQPSLLETAGEKISQTSKSIILAAERLIANTTMQAWNGVKAGASMLASGASFSAKKIGEGIVIVFTPTKQALVLLAQTISTTAGATTQGVSSTLEIIATNYHFLAQVTPGVIGENMETVGSEVQNTSNAIGAVVQTIENDGKLAVTGMTKELGNTTKNAQDAMANTAFFAGQQIQNTSETIGHAFIQLGYLLISEPTTISNVQVAASTPTSATIIWTTNHPANGKVNYGLTTDYGQDVQSEKRVTEHEFTITNLEPNTIYHYEVMSHNNNYVYDANHTFTTPAEPKE